MTADSETAKAHDAKPRTGLTSAEAERRFAEFGPNEPAPPPSHTFLRAVARLFLNPLIFILLLAAGIAGFTGQTTDAGIITVVVLLGAGLDLLQAYRSENTIKTLRGRFAPTARVLRDGEWQTMPSAQLVPGDIVELTAGALIPGDARLLESKDLFVQEAALTGESLPVEKLVSVAGTSEDSGSPNLVFLGSSVVSGVATAEIVATGARTMFGKIAAKLSERAQETAFDRGLKSFSGLIARTVLFLVLFLIAVSIAMHRDPLQSLLFAVALAVGLTPEFLPMITSVTLSKGALAMARKHVIVKHLSAIQNLGSIDILCSDKTGTLTAGAVKLRSSMDLNGAESDFVRLLGFLNSHFETGIRSVLDDAVCAVPLAAADEYHKLDEIPFDFERRRVSIVVQRGVGPSAPRLLIVKGAPEAVFAIATNYVTQDGTKPLDDAARNTAQTRGEAMASDGLRLLGVAYKEIPEKAAYKIEDEEGLTLAGFLCFEDPPLADAAQALKDLEDDGVTVKMITGDSELVAGHVAREVGLSGTAVITGREMESVSDAAMPMVAEQSAVFARIFPAGKSRIIASLKRGGHVVGFLGDGINDAPSLRLADVGISVATATDVARDAADIVLLEPGLHVLNEGILEGRRAFGNVMKYLLMGTSSNFGNMLSMAGASVFLPFLPMLPTQILLNTFLYDLAQISIPTDNVDESFLRKPQHWDVALIRRFMVGVGPISSIFDFLTFYVLLHYFHAGQAEFQTGWFVESLATQTLVLFVIRTAGNPFRSRPSLPLAVTTLAVVAVGVIIPFSPVAPLLGFVPLPGSYFVFLAGMTILYLGLVDLAKRRVLRAANPI